MTTGGPTGFGETDLDALPDWAPDTVAVLVTGAEDPHGIPISTAVRLGPRTIVFALALRRGSLARLRDRPRCALTVMSSGDVAFTAHGEAAIVEEPMAIADNVAAIRVDVDVIRSHGRDTFQIEAGVRWRWTDAEAERRDAEIRAALRRLRP